MEIRKRGFENWEIYDREKDRVVEGGLKTQEEAAELLSKLSVLPIKEKPTRGRGGI